ncbi:MAG: metal-dependent hydrolase [Xenococcus sp. (in: cyanobacteria)]
MMSITHATFSVSLTSIVLGTANPAILGVSAIASLLPDIDTSKSFIGRLFFPLSCWIETRTVHRGITHSFFATGMITLITYPLAAIGYSPIWKALILGYFWGWFADVFTKSGVEAFYPSRGRLIIPRNPHLRLGTRSRAEWFLLMVLVAIAIISININSAGGIIRGFNQALGLPSGAVEVVSEDTSRYLLTAHIKGRNAITEMPIDASYEVIEPLTANDLLVKDSSGMIYRVGQSQECQIIASQIRVERVKPIKTKVSNLILDDEDIYTAVQFKIQNSKGKMADRIYLSGTLTIFDAEDLTLPTHLDRFDTITLQPGSDIAYARLVSANPQEVMKLLGDYYASGNLIVRTIAVNSE